MGLTPNHTHVHINAAPTIRHRGAGSRRRQPEPTRAPWPALVGGATAVVGGVISAEEFIAAGWTSSQIIGLLAGFVTLAGLLLAVWGKLLKVQDEQSRLLPRAVLDRNTVYKAAYTGACDAVAGKPSSGTTGHEFEGLAYQAARAADGALNGSGNVAA